MTVSGSGIEYTCVSCDGKVEAVIEIVSPYGPGVFGSMGRRYLTERRVFCGRLAGDRDGRCVGTRAVILRGGALRGFRSETETGEGTETEIVIFYSGAFGPELIRTTVSVGRGAALPPESLAMFLWHMAKLTAFW